MKFKLDENLSPTLSALFVTAGHDAHSVIEQALSGKPDEKVIAVCKREGRALISLDLDFANIHAYPPGNYSGILVIRTATQAHVTVLAALTRALNHFHTEPLSGKLWIVEETRIRIHD